MPIKKSVPKRKLSQSKSAIAARRRRRRAAAAKCRYHIPCYPGLRPVKTKTGKRRCVRMAKSARPLKRLSACGYTRDQLYRMARSYNHSVPREQRIPHPSLMRKSQLARHLRLLGKIPKSR